MQNNLVSILIPTYNREKIIGETILSALAQTYENLEVIIVDNASTDGTWDIIQKFLKEDSRIKAYRNKTNLGPVRNWERCIDKARGKYGKILWSDDLIAADFLEKTVPYLSSNDIGFVFTGTEIFIDGTNQKSPHYFIGESGVYDSEKYINGVLFSEEYPRSPGCALFRLKDLKQSLLVNIPNKVGSDFAMHAIGNDLLIFLLTAQYYSNFVFVNEKLSFFRAHAGSISIQSNDGRLPLHYNLASAYFVENYRKDLVNKMNANIWFNIKKFGTEAKRYNLDKIDNFYLRNTNQVIDWNYMIRKILQKFLIKIGVIE